MPQSGSEGENYIPPSPLPSPASGRGGYIGFFPPLAGFVDDEAVKEITNEKITVV
jgi:hypothetical protein